MFRQCWWAVIKVSAILCGSVAVWRFVVGCRRLRCPGSRGDHGGWGGFVPGRTPRPDQPLARRRVAHCPRATWLPTPPTHSTNSLLPLTLAPPDVAVVSAFCEDELSNSLLLRLERDWPRRSNAMLGRWLPYSTMRSGGSYVCCVVSRALAMLGQKLGLLGGRAACPDDLSG